jgi:2-dehydropantoate 2-reductase
MREGNNITQDGTGEIVFGIKSPELTQKSDVELVKNFFDSAKINYETPEDMMRAYWLKFMLNVSSNQPSAILRLTFGQMQSNEKFLQLFKKIIEEVRQIAQAEGVKNTDTMYEEALEAFKRMIPDGKTSMLQDVEAGRKTEVEIFAGTMVELGKKHNIPTPYNQVLKDLIEIID